MARTAIHPGEILTDEVEFPELSAAEFARAIKVPANRVSQILNGSRAITADTAIRHGTYFGTSPEFRMNLQSLYELRLAEQSVGANIRASVEPRVKATA